MTRTLRLAVYEALEERSYLTIQDLALRLDSGAPATQAQVRSVLYAEPETFYQMEDWWDLAIFHRFEGQTFQGKGRGGFDERKFLGRVLAEALQAKGRPIQLKTLAEKYLLKIRNRLGLPKNQFPRGSGEILERLRRFLADHPDYHLLHDECGECVWNAPAWTEAVEPAPVVAPTYRLPDDFLERAAIYLETRGAQPVRLLDILTAVLGIDASHSDFATAFAQANAALSADDETFAQVQEQAWMLANYLPAGIEDIPARVAIPRWRNPQEEQLIAELYALPLDALAEAASFAGDDAREAAPAQFDEGYTGPLRLALPYHWRQNGVLKVNASERRLFPDRPARAHLQFTDQTGQTFPVWLNNDTGYLHGLKEWYAAYLVPAGGVFYIERAPGSQYNFKVWVKEAASRTFDGKQYFCEVDGDTYIEEDRLRDLEALRVKVEAAAATIKDVMCDLFESCPADTALHYRQVWAQAHVIRPTTRRTVAAILSAFPCFYQADLGSGFWRYAPGLRNAPPKYQARRVPKPAPAVKPVPVEARLPRFWLAPVSAASWDKLARPAGAGESVFLAPWRGRSRVRRGDGVAFFDAAAERVIAAAEALRQPILDATTGRRELAVKPALDAFNPIPYADLAGALSVPKLDLDGHSVEITPEHWQFLLERLRPTTVLEPIELPAQSREDIGSPVAWTIVAKPEGLEMKQSNTSVTDTQGADIMPVPSMTSDNAFAFLHSEVETHLAKLQTGIAEAAKQGAFDKAGELVKKAQELDGLKQELSVLAKRYKHFIEGEEHEETPAKSKRILQGPKTPKNVRQFARGLKTPQEAYHIPILQALIDLGGRSEIRPVLERVRELMEGQLNEHDLAPIASDGLTPRWRNTAQWARNDLREKGLVRDDTPRAVWEISEKGRAWLAKQTAVAKK